MAQEGTVVTQALLQEMAEAAAQEVQPEAIIVFGSRATRFGRRFVRRECILMEDIAYHTTKAIYRAGTLILHKPLDLAENTEVELIVLRPQVIDPQAKARLLETVTQRMRRNAWPRQALEFTREELHARR